MAEKVVSEERDKAKPRAIPVSKDSANDNTSVAGGSSKSTSTERTQVAQSLGKIPSKTSAKQMCKTVEAEILAAVKNVQATLQRQDQKINSLGDRMSEVEKYAFDYEHDIEGEEENPEYDDNEEQEGDEPSALPQTSVSMKRKSEDSNSRFSSMVKRFKNQEHCDVDIDGILAENITDFFRNGIDQKRYEELVKDEVNGRPANCEGLVTVKTNQLVWDAVTPTARSNDIKFQNIETSVVKAATVLTKIVNSMASIENEHSKFEEMIDNCNTSLALLGHANRQICMVRKDLFRQELREEYSHLCAHSLAYTNWLFGDDISKKTKEIEDSNKLCNKAFRGRGGFRGRFGNRDRHRGRGRGGPMRGKPYKQSYFSSSNYDAKNSQKKGTNKSAKV